MESEGIHFSLPRTTSDRYAIQKIVCVGDTNIVVLQLADTSISYEIWLGDSEIDAYAADTTEYHFGAFATYVNTAETSGITTYYSYTRIGDDIHCIASHQLEDIEYLIVCVE